MNIVLGDSEKNALKALIESDQSSIVLKDGTAMGFVYAERIMTISIEDPRGIKCVVLGQDKRIIEFLDIKKIPIHRPKVMRIYPNGAKKLLELVIKEYGSKFEEAERFYIDTYVYDKTGELIIGRFALMDNTPVYDSANFWAVYDDIVGSAKACINAELLRSEVVGNKK